ncbi:MAG TPA: hypothetical protein VG992_03140 [Candidatus Saccharimonadales bacterium]|nr:hypothetical protein [Candidatus Saccharimonadales bacterium]
MDASNWQKQAADTPLFPDLLWSRPEQKSQAGKLLIIGGNAHGFVAPAEAFTAAEAAGIGSVRMLLPDSLRTFVGKVFEAGELLPSTPSGSFAKTALAEIIAHAAWADGVLLAGDLGRNSETAIVLEQCLEKYHGQLTITQDALDYFVANPTKLLDRPDTLLVASFGQIQKIASAAHFIPALTFDMDLVRLVEALQAFSAKHAAALIVKHLDQMIMASNGQVSTTKLANDLEVWRVRTAAAAATWWLQNPGRAFEALTTSLVTPDVTN